MVIKDTRMIDGFVFMNITKSVRTWCDLEKFAISISNSKNCDKVLFIECQDQNRELFKHIIKIVPQIKRELKYEFLYRSGYMGILENTLSLNSDWGKIVFLEIGYIYE